jgi:MFS superfamily sulfate permease-like transporter
MRIYNLLFYKSYQLAIRSKNFDDLPVLGGLIFVAACVMFNIFTVFGVLQGIGIIDSNLFDKKYKYIFSLLLILVLLGYYLYKNRYIRILDRFESNGSNFIKRIHPVIVIIVYYVLSFALLLLAAFYKNRDWIFQNIPIDY